MRALCSLSFALSVMRILRSARSMRIFINQRTDITEENMIEYLRIGVITQPHGIKGEVKVYPTTDDLDRFNQVEDVLLETKKGRTPMKIQGVKYFKGMAILKLSGINSMDEAETWRQADIMIHRSQSPLEEGQYFIADLIGCTVYRDDDTILGELTDVLQTGANDVFEVKRPDGKEVLLPRIPECILSIDVEARKIRAYVIPGLED